MKSRQPIANMVNVPLSSTGWFRVRSVRPAHVYADVLGYYVRPAYAAITSSGAVYNGNRSGLVASTRLGTGRYRLTFDRNVDNCAVAGNSLTSYNVDVTGIVHSGGDNQYVYVYTRDWNNSYRDTAFEVSLTC